MVCVKSVKLVLDDFILQVKNRKVNPLVDNFTICLQDFQFCRICSQNVQRNAIIPSLTSEGFRAMFSMLIISVLNI